MALNLLDENKGCPIDRQRFTWKELVQPPISKLDDDAFTRVRIILMNGIEMEALRFSHSCARMNGDLQLLLAQLRRVEQHQASMVNGLIGADHSTLETTIGYEQVAIEVTAAVAQAEPDEYLAQVYRFGMLEDFDHLYRYTALLDRLEGKDANNITQCYTDIVPGRPTVIEHRAPEDDLREHYDRSGAEAISKLHALTIMSAEQQTHNFYMNVGRVMPIRWPASSMLKSHRSKSSMLRNTSPLSTLMKAGWKSGCCMRRTKSTTITAACSRNPIRASRRSGSVAWTTSWAICMW